MPYGLIAGNGRFPVLALEAAKKAGLDVVAIGIKEEASPEIEPLAVALPLDFTRRTQQVNRHLPSGRHHANHDVRTSEARQNLLFDRPRPEAGEATGFDRNQKYRGPDRRSDQSSQRRRHRAAGFYASTQRSTRARRRAHSTQAVGGRGARYRLWPPHRSRAFRTRYRPKRGHCRARLRRRRSYGRHGCHAAAGCVAGGRQAACVWSKVPAAASTCFTTCR